MTEPTAEKSAKPSLTSVPKTALLLQSQVHAFGSGKHGGAFSWRLNEQSTLGLLDKVYRHLMQFETGDDIDGESGLSHLAHAIADLNIMIDSQVAGNLIDDRFPITAE